MESNYSNSYLTDDHRKTLYDQADKNANEEVFDQIVLDVCSVPIISIIIQFNSKKMGDDEITSLYRSTLDETLIDLHKRWEDLNISRKNQYIAKESSKASVASIIGAVVGGILGGPPGAVAGVLLGGAGSYAFSWANR